MPENEIISILRKQKTTNLNEFTEKIIPDEKIDIIKSSIVHTANTSNRQIYSVIILSRDQLQILELKQGSHAFIFCVDYHRLHKLADYLKKPFDSSYLTQFVSGIVDISLLAQSAIMAANSLGIDTLITNEPYLEYHEELFSKLKLPFENCIPMLIVYLGYNQNAEKKGKGRLPLDIVFHEGTYNELNDRHIQEIIDLYDGDETRLALNDSWKKLGYNHYLEWFFEKWSPVIGSRKNSEKFEEEMIFRKMI
jgi:FMN reductase [NAD(P)H]